LRFRFLRCGPLDFRFQKREILLRNDVQLPDEGQRPILGSPLPNILQARPYLESIDVLFVVQDAVRFDIDALMEIFPGVVVLPDRRVVLERVGRHGRCRSEHTAIREVIEDPIFRCYSTRFSAFVVFEPLNLKPSLAGDMEIFFASDKHPVRFRQMVLLAVGEGRLRKF
jgi:hypothetical protein